MAKSSKLIAVKRGRILLVRRRRDHLWMFPGGQKRERESEKECLRREIKEELPKLKLGRVRLWKEVNGTNRHSGRKMSDAIFIVNKVSGDLTIGDKHEIDKATWRKPRGIRLTAEDIRQARERRLAQLRVHAHQSAPEPEREIIVQRQSGDARRYRLGKSMSLM